MKQEYEYYAITARKCIKGDTGNEFTGPNNDEEYDVVKFKVRATAHLQHIWSSTYLEGLTKSATARIANLKADNYIVTTRIGDRDILVNN